MLKGSEITFKLNNVDCDPKLKEIIIQQQQDIFFLRKELITLATNFDKLVDQMTVLSTASEAFGRQLQNVSKHLKNDEANDE